VGVSGVAAEKQPLSKGRLTVNSLKWAVLLPVLMFVAGAVTLWSLILGVFFSLAVLAVATVLLGSTWGRPWAAVVGALSIGGVMLFAGQATYDLYLAGLGEPVSAVVVQVVDEDNRRGNDLVCTVAELGGEHKTHELTQRENCWEQYKAGDQVEILKDPLGIVEPRLPDTHEQQNDHRISYQITIGLTLLTALTVFVAGRRRKVG
jgi:hypothetical protein